MVSGPDIITYIGVPLAVLGVAPIIYNTVTTLVTLAKVRRILRHARISGITRGDVINHVIEVELPRYTIAPLHRQEQYKDYWNLSDYPSAIPGGSWTIFNWKAHTIGLKTQRIDYSDQLRQPQAEIGFEELVSFLLDLGAVPDPAGFRMLRGSGLWVPTGTPLLVSPETHEKVLSIAPLDDSDGHLSLCVQWSSHWAMRDHNSLPPYWVLVKGCAPKTPVFEAEAVEEKASDVETEIEIPKGEKKGEKNGSTSRYLPDSELAPPAIRCQIGVDGLAIAIRDDRDSNLFDDLDIDHLKINEPGMSTIGIWFASAITALGTTSETILWNYKIPSDILSFTKIDSIPCGVLVLLDVVGESATPEWATKYNDIEEEREAQFRKLKKQSSDVMKEMQMSPADRAKAARERQMQAHDDWVQERNAAKRRDAQRAETRMLEAMQSPKWNNKLVAEHNLAWLKKEGHVEQDHDLKRSVEILLWKMFPDLALVEELGKLLDNWKKAVDNGGIKRADFLVFKESQVMFAYASLLIALVQNSVTAAHGSLAMDLQECVRIWKKVRLG